MLLISRFRPEVNFFISLTSHFLADGLAQQAGGLHQQHDDKHRKDHRVGDVGIDHLGKGLDDTQQDAAQHGAGDGADAAEHGSGKGLDAGQGAGGGHQSPVAGAQQHTGDGGQSGADGKGHGDGAVDVDAHELSGRLILGAGPHGLAHLGLTGEPGEGQHDDDASQYGNQRHIGDVHTGDGQGALRDDGGKHLGIGAPQQQGGVLQEIADANGGDEHRQGGRLTQGLVGQSFDDDAQDGTYHHSQQYAHHRGQIKAAGGKEGHIGAHHDDVAVGKVQHLCDAVHHGVAQGDDGVDAAQADTGDQIIEEAQTIHLSTCFLCSVYGRNIGGPAGCRCFHHTSDWGYMGKSGLPGPPGNPLSFSMSAEADALTG